MAFLEQDPVRCKIFVDNKCLQKVKNFIHLGCEISYENETFIQQKLAKFAQTLGILNNTFKQTLVQRVSRIQVYKALAFPILLYGSKIWTLTKRVKNDWPESR